MFASLLRCALIVAAAGVLFLAAERADAHAIVIDSSPAVNTTIAESDVSIVLRFNSRIDHRRSRLTLLGPDGTPLPLPVDASGGADSLRGRATGLQPGTYRVHWQVLAVDGHITRGDIPFTVARP